MYYDLIVTHYLSEKEILRQSAWNHFPWLDIQRYQKSSGSKKDKQRWDEEESSLVNRDSSGLQPDSVVHFSAPQKYAACEGYKSNTFCNLYIHIFQTPGLRWKLAAFLCYRITTSFSTTQHFLPEISKLNQLTNQTKPPQNCKYKSGNTYTESVKANKYIKQLWSKKKWKNKADQEEKYILCCLVLK